MTLDVQLETQPAWDWVEVQYWRTLHLLTEKDGVTRCGRRYLPLPDDKFHHQPEVHLRCRRCMRYEMLDKERE